MIDRIFRLAAAGVLLLAMPADAANGGVVHIQKDESPIAGMVVVPPGATTYYVSGMIPPVVNPNAPKGSVESYGDTKTQTEGALSKIKDALAEQNLGFGDVVMMHVYLAGDPNKDGKMDFAGMMEAYKEFFGTAEQPNKPARSTVQVAALVAPGALIEIEVIAVRAP
jgi:enamine deaminase RidA (YjgF/YER057c/UK114 family)